MNNEIKSEKYYLKLLEKQKEFTEEKFAYF